MGSRRFEAERIPLDRPPPPSLTTDYITGHETVRNLWKEYYSGADAVVFVVDSADNERFEEAKQVLSFVLPV